MKLYCMRHGEALPAIENAERPLSAKGIVDVQKTAAYLKLCHLSIDHIMHSPRQRAVQTAKIMATALQINRVTECKQGLDEMDDAHQLVENIYQWHDATLLVSHLPFLSKLTSLLLLQEEPQPIIHFSPGSIACLHQFEDRIWNITWLLNPQIIPEDLPPTI